MPQIIIKNIWAEDLFEWFYEHIRSSGGDGCGAIICNNYKQVSEWFIAWCHQKWKKEHPQNSYFLRLILESKFFHDKDEYGDTINFHDNNENFIFSKNELINFANSMDYVFIIKEDCRFGFESNSQGKIIKAV